MERIPPYRIIGCPMTTERPGALPAPPINGSMSGEELGKAFDDSVAPLVGADKFAGLVLLAKNGSIVVQKAYGAARRVGKKAETAEARFSS